MVLPGKLIKTLKAAVKSRKWMVMVFWYDPKKKEKHQDKEPLFYGYTLRFFPLGMVDEAIDRVRELFWKRHKGELEKTKSKPPPSALGSSHVTVEKSEPDAHK